MKKDNEASLYCLFILALQMFFAIPSPYKAIEKKFNSCALNTGRCNALFCIALKRTFWRFQI